MKRIATTLSLFLIALVTMLGVTPHVQAAPSGLYLNPSSGTYQKDSSFNVQVRINAGSNSGVQANMDFDASKLQVLGHSNQGSALNSVTVAYDNGSGKISVYSVNGSSSGDRLITTLNFRATGTGNAPVSFARTNQTLGYVVLVPVWSNISTNNASYTITGTNNPTPPPPSGSGSSSGSGSAGNSDTPSSKPEGSTSKSTPQGTTPMSSSPNNGASTAPGQINDELPGTPQNHRRPAPDFQTTQPNTEPWESYHEPIPTSAIIVPWLPIIATSSLGLLTLAIFAAYRRTHLSNAMRRLVASVISYRISLSEKKQSVLARPLPLVAKIMPKLLALKSPKLLASGIKTHLLLTAGSVQHLLNSDKRK